MVASLAEAVDVRESGALKEERDERHPTRQSFVDYSTRWMTGHAANLADSSRERYARAVAHAIVSFGDIAVHRIVPLDIRNWRNDLRREGHAKISVNGYLRIIRQVLDDAVADGHLPGNPAKKVKMYKTSRTKGRRGQRLTVEQFRAFRDAMQDLTASEDLAPDIARLIEAVGWTGCRRGEMMALRWEDYRDGELHVRRSVWNRREKAPKSDEYRQVSVPVPLAAVLQEQRRWLLETQHPGLASGLLFPASPRHAMAGATRRQSDEVSWYRSPSVLDRPLRKICDKAGVPEISTHALRRNYENLLREAGIDHLVRRELAGWSSDKVQGDYGEIGRQEKRAAADSLTQLVIGDVPPRCDPQGNEAEKPQRRAADEE